METLSIPPDSTAMLKASLRNVCSPYADIEEFLASIYPVFAALPAAVLRRLLAFGRDPGQFGVLHLSGFPVDENLPPTPLDGRRSSQKQTFLSEASVLGISQILGQPIGYYAEKGGEIVHNLCPVSSEAHATSSESSQTILGFHTDFNFDKDNPSSPYNVVNPDYVVLVCLRADRNGQAQTRYADARRICERLSSDELNLLRQPLFQFAASYSFTGRCDANRIWSVPCPVIQGPDRYPEISIDLLCGVRALTADASAVLDRIRQVCELPGVAAAVRLRPGDVLLMDNRKGAHARSTFDASHDGYDRWLQRVYVRRSLWEMRSPTNDALRVF